LEKSLKADIGQLLLLPEEWTFEVHWASPYPLHLAMNINPIGVSHKAYYYYSLQKVFFRDPFALFLGHHAMGLDVHNECKIEFQRRSSSRDSFLLFSLGRISFKPEPYRTWVAGSI
jgi:hypothetical protein